MVSSSPRTRSTKPGRKVKGATGKKQSRKSVTRNNENNTSESEGDAYVNDEEDQRGSEEDEKVYDSDNLDDDNVGAVSKKRKRGLSTSAKRKTSESQSPKREKRPSPSKRKRHNSNDEEGNDFELDDGQEIVGRVVQAPTAGRVPPGQISQNTLDFLTKLKDPSCNDRQWFKLHEPVYRQAETEWKHFIEAFTELLIGVDPQIPPLPAKDVIHRIYRDIRFSNDKTPYKTGFSASFSRTGRKGIFAGYHISVRPGGHSIIGAGTWSPGRAELNNIRTNIQRSSKRLRRILSAPEFVLHFGEPQPSEDGRQSIFGMEDELKVAPKGVDKDHKDIDLLKCRSFCVSQRFTDKDVLLADFKQKLTDAVQVMRPFVHCLNDMMTVNAGQEESDEDDDEGDQSTTEE